MGDCGPAVSPQHATPVGNPAHPTPTPHEISVLITGFGPFKTNLVNASYLIASSLPPSFTFPKEEPAVERRISLHVHPAPLPVVYASVRESLPLILDEFAASHGGRRPDLVIHIGIASPRPYYSVETLAHRDNYTITDINGCSGYEDGEKRWKEMGLPTILSPGRAIKNGPDAAGPHPPNDHFLQAWKSFAPSGLDLRISHDAGHYLCDFIFYTSLSLAFQQGQDRNVLFLHVPGASQDADIDRGRKITLALIKAMVTCWIDEKHSA
ncbi:Peptidase C15 pyroglutamyl peptidase I [Penicillium hispanicum]|uniref:Peptidase C15 pyroglutamyl peptidase I n=1 Tax=Penicillium hispanicum TaxID=1080232 RepID=UPI002540CABC|nr:Peptidase C15 pyroglutamyl peptidase I [Penicillium hispanicum]KAJ5585496.1 Peptidase C15 pyroglutamyl peptidase I [Penicillium hispanicum]